MFVGTLILSYRCIESSHGKERSLCFLKRAIPPHIEVVRQSRKSQSHASACCRGCLFPCCFLNLVQYVKLKSLSYWQMYIASPTKNRSSLICAVILTRFCCHLYHVSRTKRCAGYFGCNLPYVIIQHGVI